MVRNNKLDFYLLLLYSLLPGIYKIIDNQALMALSIPIVLFLLSKGTNRIILKKIDALFLFYLFYIILLCTVQFFLPKTNKLGLMTGVFLDIIPMVGFFYSRKSSFENFIKIIIPIGLIHLIIGVILYPFFGIYSIFGNVSEVLQEGVAYGRMSSVSGSLGFASLMFIVSIGALYYDYKKFFLLLIGVIMAAQRSGWLACFVGCTFYCIVNYKNGNYKIIKIWLLEILSFIAILTIFIVKYDIDISFFTERFNDIGGATSERDGQWVAGIENFFNQPIGAGSGQVGQVASRYEEGEYNVVPDGDYFRIISEFGIMGGIFYVVFLFLLFILFIKVNKNYSKELCCIISLFLGISIQMIGSNITEFYFTNFLYWTLVGYLFIEFNKYFSFSKRILK